MQNFYEIKDEKFKSIYFSFNFTMPVSKREISQNAVLAAVMSKSCQKYQTQREIEIYLNRLYGASFDINVEKLGDLYNIEFRIECINKAYLPNHEDVVPAVLEFMNQMIFYPNLVQGKFDEETVEREKMYMIERIMQKKDEKLKYAVIKTEELMGNGDSFGEYVFGDVELVKRITPADLYKRYLAMLQISCITVITSGNLAGYENIRDTINAIFSEKLDSKLTYESLQYNKSNSSHHLEKVKEIEETQETTQSVITFGMRIKDVSLDDFYILNVYNAILGGTPSSKLFQNFREKESLAYTVRSRYYRYKNIFIIYAGIQKKNYEKAKEVIIRELNDIAKGNITEEEFNASKQSIISDLNEWYDSKIALCKMKLANIIFEHGKEVSLEDMIEKIQTVTKEDVIKIANRIELEKIFLLGGEADV